jgi:thiol:disulfide interchange protein
VKPAGSVAVTTKQKAILDNYYDNSKQIKSFKMVKFIKNMDEFNAMLETSKSKLVVVDFTASWCGYVET